MRPTAVLADATAGVLAGIGALHVAWGQGSTFPFRDRAALNDAVVGRAATPSPAACRAVAGLLLAATGLVVTAAHRGDRLARVGALGVAVVLTVRGAAGIAGRTDALVPGSTSPRFRRLDRRALGPLCLALAAGAATAAAARF